jgi:hypothetical protein
MRLHHRGEKASTRKALAIVVFSVVAFVALLWLMRDVIFFWICVFSIFAVL